MDAHQPTSQSFPPSLPHLLDDLFAFDFDFGLALVLVCLLSFSAWIFSFLTDLFAG